MPGRRAEGRARAGAPLLAPQSLRHQLNGYRPTPISLMAFTTWTFMRSAGYARAAVRTPWRRGRSQGSAARIFARSRSKHAIASESKSKYRTQKPFLVQGSGARSKAPGPVVATTQLGGMIGETI